MRRNQRAGQHRATEVIPHHTTILAMAFVDRCPHVRICVRSGLILIHEKQCFPTMKTLFFSRDMDEINP
jgi:hypothetical protein